MTWHFLEVWGLLLVAFAMGGVLGTLLHMGLAASPLAEAQIAAADAVDEGFGAIRGFFGRWRKPVAAYSVHRDPPAYVVPLPASGAMAEAERDPAHAGALAAGYDEPAHAEAAHPGSEAVVAADRSEAWVGEVAEALGVAGDTPVDDPGSGGDQAWVEDDPQSRGEDERPWTAEGQLEERDGSEAPVPVAPPDDAGSAATPDAAVAGDVRPAAAAEESVPPFERAPAADPMEAPALEAPPDRGRIPPPPAPDPEPVVAREPELPSMRPLTLPEPRNGVPDNLQRMRGIGQKNEALLNSLGIYHFGQIAAWTPAEARWVASHLAFPDRIERDDWIGQAIVFAMGGDTGFVKTRRRRKDDGEESSAAA